MEELPVRRAAGIENRDRRMRRPSLRRVHRRAVGMIEMAQLGVRQRKVELGAFPVAEAHPPVVDLHDLRFAAR